MLSMKYFCKFRWLLLPALNIEILGNFSKYTLKALKKNRSVMVSFYFVLQNPPLQLQGRCDLRTFLQQVKLSHAEIWDSRYHLSHWVWKGCSLPAVWCPLSDPSVCPTVQPFLYFFPFIFWITSWFSNLSLNVTFSKRKPLTERPSKITEWQHFIIFKFLCLWN